MLISRLCRDEAGTVSSGFQVSIAEGFCLCKHLRSCFLCLQPSEILHSCRPNICINLNERFRKQIRRLCSKTASLLQHFGAQTQKIRHIIWNQQHKIVFSIHIIHLDGNFYHLYLQVWAEGDTLLGAKKSLWIVRLVLKTLHSSSKWTIWTHLWR